MHLCIRSPLEVYKLIYQPACTPNKPSHQTRIFQSSQNNRKQQNSHLKMNFCHQHDITPTFFSFPNPPKCVSYHPRSSPPILQGPTATPSFDTAATARPPTRPVLQPPKRQAQRRFRRSAGAAGPIRHQKPDNQKSKKGWKQI